MPKKTSGGGNQKHRARKFEVGDNCPTRLDTADPEKGECYAVVMRREQGGAKVLCEDGATIFCHIRGKFRLHKRNNYLTQGTGVIVAKRDYERRDTHCDLVRVFESSEVLRIPSLTALCRKAGGDEHADDDGLLQELLDGCITAKTTTAAEAAATAAAVDDPIALDFDDI